jgi:hypothetical protein
MKYFAVFALLTLAVIVVANAGEDSDEYKQKDPCGAKLAGAAKCGAVNNQCYPCLVKECFRHALKNDCQALNICIANSACAPPASG